MHSREHLRDKQLAQMLFVLKIMFMLFSAFPIFERVFTKTGTDSFTLVTPSLTVILTLTAVVVILAFFVLSTFTEERHKKLVSNIELPLFFVIYFISLWFSGLHQSYYKFIFIFVIIYYTISHSKKVGFQISAVASVVVLGIDLVASVPGQVNIHFQQDLALVVSFFVVAQILGMFTQVQQDYTNYLKECANIDMLTGIFNHRSFYQNLESAYAKSSQEGTPLSLIMLDVDYFKSYNDLYGHQRGDEVLRSMASLVGDLLTEDQVLARYGGDEFAIILPGLDMECAQEVAERIHQAACDYEFPGQEALPYQNLTISLGLATREAMDNGCEALIMRADAALYRAKYLRRNSVEIYASAIDKYNQENGLIGGESLNSLKTLISIINSRDSYTYNHVERVVYYCEVFADYSKMEPEQKRRLLYAAYLHDLGKINIPKEVLIKSTPLNDEEWEFFKQHPKNGYDILTQIGELQDIAPIVLQHHERYDGRGYPQGLSGEGILFLARVLTLADCFDAMTTDRPYSKKKTFAEGFTELRRCAGSQFDPALTESFIESLQSIANNGVYLEHTEMVRIEG